MSFLRYPPPLADVICHAGDASDIPQHSPAGSGSLSYDQGFPPITSLPMGFGGIAPRREDFNAALKLLSEHAHYHQSGGQMSWSPDLDYAERCEVYGSDGNKYVAQQASGPSVPSAGAKDPVLDDDVFWKRWDLAFAKVADAGPTVKGVTRLATPEEARESRASDAAVTPAGLKGCCFYRIGEFKSWFETVPPPGWAIRNGGVLLNAQTHYPELWTALHQPENAWKRITESEWQAMSAAAPWNGVGGVPYFVLDAEAGTVRLPDTRGMYAEDAGFDGLDVGGVHGDAIREIDGSVTGLVSTLFDNGNGALKFKQGPVAGVGPGGICRSVTLYFDVSPVVPVANKNQPRAFGILPCVYIGGEQ